MLLEHDIPWGNITLSLIALATLTVTALVWQLKRKSNGKNKTKVIETDSASQCLGILKNLEQWTKNVSFYKVNDEGVKTHYVRGSAQKALETLAERFEQVIEESDDL